MEPTAACRRRQRAAFARQRAALDGPTFSRLLGTDELASLIDSQMPGHRVRTFPPALTLSMFLSQVLGDDRSCQAVLDEHLARLIDQGTTALPSASTGAYSRARARLPPSLIGALCRRVGTGVSAGAEPRWRWHGRRALLIDGTTVSMPDTPENQSAYPQPSSQAPGLGFPLARVVALGCLATGAVLDATLSSIKGPGNDERSRFHSLMDQLGRADVVVGDSGFESYWAIAELIERGVDGLFEINGARAVPGRAAAVRLRRPYPSERPAWMTLEQYHRVPETLTLRRVRAARYRGAQKKTLLTTMTDARAVSNEELVELYRRRWAIELDLRSIKQNLGMEILSCTRPAMVERELWVHLLGYNLIRAVMAEAAVRHGREPRRMSFRHAQQLWGAWRRRGAVTTEASMEGLCGALVRIEVGKRPGRREPRANKRRPRAQRLLKRPRAQARLECERYEKR